MPNGPAVTNLRGLPDIAMAADAFSGAYNIYGGNVPGVGDCSAGCAIGGTSEASPLAMGAYARLMSGHANALGFAATQFYRNYVENQNSAATVTGPPPTQTLGGFHDIISGGNGLYTAIPGYDYTTGLGTLDVALIGARRSGCSGQRIADTARSASSAEVEPARREPVDLRRRTFGVPTKGVAGARYRAPQRPECDPAQFPPAQCRRNRTAR